MNNPASIYIRSRKGYNPFAAWGRCSQIQFDYITLDNSLNHSALLATQLQDDKTPMPSKPSTQQVIDADQAQQQIDPEQLVRDNIVWMLRLAERLLGERALAEDAVQDAFISAFRSLEKFEGRSSLKTWLHRITVNASLTKLRQSKRRAEQSIDEDQPEFDQYDCRIEAPWNGLTSLEDVIEKADLRERVNESIEGLPDSYRIVLQLRDIEGYDTSEVAEQLDISDANVKIRLHRARAALKKRLEPILRGEVPE